MKKLGIQILICAAMFASFVITEKIDEGGIAFYSDMVKAHILEDSSFTDIKDNAVSVMSRAAEKPKEIYAAIKNSGEANDFISPVDEASAAVFNKNSHSDDLKYMSDDVIIVYASANGMSDNIEYNEESEKYTVTIKHDEGIYTRYEGCTKVYIEEKERVSQGRVIGEVENEGIRDLVFEIWKNGEKADPGDYIK